MEKRTGAAAPERSCDTPFRLTVPRQTLLFRFSSDEVPRLTLPKLKILLCAPRGFCAGVDRAIQIVDLALVRYGAPVYVRHEIVHNKYVVEELRAKGAVRHLMLHRAPGRGDDE